MYITKEDFPIDIDDQSLELPVSITFFATFGNLIMFYIYKIV